MTELTKKYNANQRRAENNAERKGHIWERQKDLEKADAAYKISERLYKLVIGQTKGNEKTSLEQYIQAAGFERIIHAANKRLKPMSDGQYELYRQKSADGARSAEFLNLEVMDYYTGRKRPVTTLSGGESFKASLSLALGLSDTVSSNSGGIQMNALFVDEGFGTLDRKSIDSAMEILMKLTEGNKLIGIISHREELVENIPQKIKVKKDEKGSKIEYD